MLERISKCGCDCFNCPTYKNNITTIEDKKKCSAGWEEFINFKLSPEKLRACDGCSIADSERKIYYLNCKVRKCTMINEVENCAFCSGFPCNELLKAHSIQEIDSREDFIRKKGIEISEKDYIFFIEPYAGINHLNKIRESLSNADIKDYKKFSTASKFSPLNIINEKEESAKNIYSLLTTLCVEENISYARQQTLKKKRNQLLKILWVLAYFGEFKSGSDFLELDSKTFSNQKVVAMYDELLEYFNVLRKYDVYCEIIPLVEKGWLTPHRGLRKDGWILRLRFGESQNGIKTLKVFKNYVLNLEKKYRKNAFRFFNKADLSVMNT